MHIFNKTANRNKLVYSIKSILIENHTNNLVGYFHHHYLLKNPENIAQYLFKTQTVCETFLTHDLLHKMISEKLNIVVVTDKNNQQIGIIALTDLLIVLFGEMEEVNY